jgi:hypothetical protein
LSFPQIPSDAKGGKWLADQVVVSNVDGGYTSTFDLKDWFDASKLQGSYFRWTSDLAFKVVIHTGKDQGSAGYDGDVYISLTGMYGSTEAKEMVNGSDPAFLPGSAESFSLTARDVGALSKV